MKITLSTLMVFGLVASCSSSEFKGSAPTAASNTANSTGLPPPPEPAPTDPGTVGNGNPENPANVTAGGDPSNATPGNETVGIFTGCATGSSSLPIVADVYSLPEGSSKLPDFKAIGPKIDTVCLSQYNIENQAWDLGFPGASQLVEWFALNTRAKLIVPTNGSYQFRMGSDDGSILYIDSAVIIDNNGNHSFQSKEGTVTLTAGSHALAVDWYQGPRFNLGLQLFWKLPGTTEFVLVPTSAFAPE